MDHNSCEEEVSASVEESTTLFQNTEERVDHVHESSNENDSTSNQQQQQENEKAEHG